MIQKQVTITLKSDFRDRSSSRNGKLLSVSQREMRREPQLSGSTTTPSGFAD
jgi:hypothetical protein